MIAVVEDGTKPAAGDDQVPGPSLVGCGPLRLLHGRSKYTGSGRRKTGSILAPSSVGIPKDPSGRRRRTWTHNLDRGIDRRVCMLLSFQRPPHRFWRGFLFRDASGAVNRLQTGPESIALGLDAVRIFCGPASRTSQGRTNIAAQRASRRRQCSRARPDPMKPRWVRAFTAPGSAPKSDAREPALAELQHTPVDRRGLDVEDPVLDRLAVDPDRALGQRPPRL